MSEKSSAWRQAGIVRRPKRAVGTPLISLGACSGGKFVVSRAGEAYDARNRGPNRKSPPTPEDGDRMSATQDLRHDFQFTSKDGLRIACGDGSASALREA